MIYPATSRKANAMETILEGNLTAVLTMDYFLGDKLYKKLKTSKTMENSRKEIDCYG